MRNAEYDRFGPWILEITDEDPLPPLFVPYFTRKDNILLQIKIPRSIDRRDASPGMNLYDYVLTMYENNFDIMKREDDNVITDCFSYHEILSIRHHEALLNGNLSLYSKNSVYEFSYSTVSSNLIKKAVEIIRRRYLTNNRNIKERIPEAAHPEKDVFNFYFESIIMQEKQKNPDNILFAYQPRTRLSRQKENFFVKALNIITAKQLLESLHFCDGSELKIINRGRNFKYLSFPIYGREDLYIPLDNLKSVASSTDIKDQSLKNIFISIEGEDFLTIFTSDNNVSANYGAFE